MKLNIQSLLALLLAGTMLLSGCTYRPAPLREPRLDPAREAELLDAYAAELALAAERGGVEITRFDLSALALLREEAVQHWGQTEYRFSQLMDKLSALVAEGEILRTYEHDWNLSLSGMEVRNVTAAVVHPYGGLQGVLAARVPVSCTYQNTAGVQVSIGPKHPLRHGQREILLDRPLTGGAPLNIEGPPRQDEETALYSDGRMSTHTFACGVLFGTVVEVSWDLCDRRTGAVRGHGSRTWVPAETAAFQVLVSYAQIDQYGAVHVNSPFLAHTAHWPRAYDFETQLERCPYAYLSGEETAVCPDCAGTE